MPLSPLLPLLYKLFPKYVTTTEQIGRAMLKVARQGWPKPVLETVDINRFDCSLRDRNGVVVSRIETIKKGLYMSKPRSHRPTSAFSPPSAHIICPPSKRSRWIRTMQIPVAPTGLAARPLPDHPVEFDTAEGQKIRVVVVTKALEYPLASRFFPMEACW